MRRKAVSGPQHASDFPTESHTRASFFSEFIGTRKDVCDLTVTNTATVMMGGSSSKIFILKEKSEQRNQIEVFNLDHLSLNAAAAATALTEPPENGIRVSRCRPPAPFPRSLARMTGKEIRFSSR